MYFYHRSNHGPSPHINSWTITTHLTLHIRDGKSFWLYFFVHQVKSHAPSQMSQSNHPVKIDRHHTSGTEKASRCFLLMFSSSSKLPDPTPVPDPIHIKWCRNYDDETMSFDEELVQCIDYCRYYTMYVPSPAVEGGHAA